MRPPAASRAAIVYHFTIAAGLPPYNFMLSAAAAMPLIDVRRAWASLIFAMSSEMATQQYSLPRRRLLMASDATDNIRRGDAACASARSAAAREEIDNGRLFDVTQQQQRRFRPHL